MPIILIPIALYALYLLERWLFNRYWERGLSVNLQFDKEAVTEGEESSLTEVITNRNFIPLHILQVNFQTDVGLDFTDTSNASVTDRVNVIDVFSLRFYEKITRQLSMKCTKRGYYSILQTSISASDLFSSDIHYGNRQQQTFLYVYPKLKHLDELDVIFNQLMGEVMSRRFLYEDNFTFRGIRDYAPTDPQSNINWKASARSGGLKVNLHDYTASPKVKIILNVDEPGILYETELLEDCIRYALTLSSMLIEKNIPVALLTNGKDKVTGEVIKLEAGASKGHLSSVRKALARIDLTSKKPASIRKIIEEELSSLSGVTVTYIYISTSRRDDSVYAADRLAKKDGKLMWLCPLTKDMNQASPANAKIQFWPMIRS